jgi:hypothetical protein
MKPVLKDAGVRSEKREFRYSRRQKGKSWSLFWAPVQSNDLATEALGAMVIDDAGRLHPCVNDNRADEFKAAFLESS